MADLDKQASFYLGKVVNPQTRKTEDELLLYKSKDLTTHAVCVGMTGSGKTGLGICLLEEAGLDKIPAIIIDPKGDLTNLLLTFPNLAPNEFKPWIDEEEAARKDMTVAEYAEYISKTWKEGLAASGQNVDRIKKLRESVEFKIYTPASKVGTPISILNSFAAPPKEQMVDNAAVLEKVQSITSSLLGLVGITADPIKSRENILISTLIYQAWQKGTNLDIATLIQQIQKPPFAKLGALPVDTFYPSKERMELSISLNALLASPGFQVWMEGDPLDIQQILYTPEGKPKLSIISIMHLTDSERMFFVTLLLNEFLTWMRQQPGTSNLRALMYMDEIFGFFPPTATPPSKLPMLTLLKQARAFGVGIILVTQNPVDLDYKGLSNCGTWFIGKLQTERDKTRIIEGLKVASNGEINAKKLDSMLAMTGNRTFIMRSIYEQDAILFQTRWTLSFLRGPMTLNQIARLVDKPLSSTPKNSKSMSEEKKLQSVSRPQVPQSINEMFLRFKDSSQPMHYAAQVLGIAKLHFVDSKNKIDIWKNIWLAAQPEDDGNNVNWEQSENISELQSQLETEPLPNSSFEELPAGLMIDKNYALFAKKLALELYQNQAFTLYQLPKLNITSLADESEKDFRNRIAITIHQDYAESEKKIRDKFAEKKAVLTNKIQRAQDKISQKQNKAFWQKWQTFISFLTTIIAAIFGRKLTQGTISQAGTSMRRAGQITKDSQEVTQAEDDLRTSQQQLTDLEAEMANEISALALSMDAQNVPLEKITIRPRKSDIAIDKISLVWRPQEK